MPRIRALVFSLLLLAACGGSRAESDFSGTRTITVFAAASLSDAFEDIAAEFRRSNPDVEVDFNFLASSDLAAQIIEGAPADVFASADEPNMAKVTDEGLATNPHVFALNRLSIAVAAGNPQGITSLSDLEDPELVVALCNVECPAGRYAQEIFDRAGLAVEADSFEADVRGVLTRVGLGEADAGLVYVTDIATDPDVEEIEIPEPDNVIASYPIVSLDGAPDEAAGFVEFVRSEAGGRILSTYGFERP